MQANIEAGPDNITLAWTPRWLLPLTVMGNILTDEDKHDVSVKIMVINAEDRDRFLKNGLRFGDKRHRMDSFIDISSDTLCTTCCYW